MRSRNQPIRGGDPAWIGGSARRSLATLALGFLATVAYATAPHELRVVNKTYDAGTGALSYELWNDSSQVITAWRLSLAAGDSLGRGHRSNMDQDFYLGLDPETPMERILKPRVIQGPLHPDQRLAATWQLDLAQNQTGRPALSIRAVAWIFADGSYGGGAEEAAALLEARAARLDQIASFLADLRGASLGTRPTSSRQARVERMAGGLLELAKSSSPDDGMKPGAAAVLSATRVDLAEWLESTEEAAAAEPTRAPEIYRALESDLDRELRIGRAQLGSSVAE